MKDDFRLLTQNEVADLLRCSPRSIQRLRRLGVLPFIPGRPPTIDERDLRAYIDRIKVPAHAALEKSADLAAAEERANKSWHRRQKRLQGVR